MRALGASLNVLMLSACASVALGGCAALANRAIPEQPERVAAEPLCAVVPYRNPPDVVVVPSGRHGFKCQPRDPLAPAGTNKEYLAGVLNESQAKCNLFVSQVMAGMQEINTTGDGLATLFSTVGTAITPLSTVHALSAASALSSGTKNVINSNVFMNATVVNLTTALLKSYGTALNSYRSQLEQQRDDTALSVPIELSKIRDVHANCSLAVAEASIAATLVSSSKAAPPVSVELSCSESVLAKNGKADLVLHFANSLTTTAKLTKALNVTLPQGLQLVGGDILGSCADASSISNAAGGTVLTFQAGMILPSGGCITQVKIAAKQDGPFTISIAAGDLQTDQGSNALGSVVVVPSSLPDSMVSLQFAASTVKVGSVAVLQVDFGKALTVPARVIDQAFTVNLNDGLTVDAHPNLAMAGSTCDVKKVTALPGATTVSYPVNAPVPPGGCTLTVNIKAPKAGNYSATAARDAFNTDQGSGSQLVTATLTVNATGKPNTPAAKPVAVPNLQPTTVIPPGGSLTNK